MRPVLTVVALLWGGIHTAMAQDAPEAEAPVEDADTLPIIQGPQILEYVEAPYPTEAQEAGVEGTVTLTISLTETGEVDSLEVSGPAGYGFDEAAVDAVLEMRFAPAQTEAGPVPVIFEFEYGFVLQPAEPEPEEGPPPPVNFEGLIREMGTRKPIAGVAVVVDGTELTAETDEEGRFTLRGVPLGEQTVRLLHTGHVALERSLDFEEGEVTVVNLWMRSEAYRDNEVVATYERREEEVTRRTIAIDIVERIPGTFGDPVKVIQTLPGAARAPFGTGLLVIRGSNPEDSGVYVDGIRIPLIYHLTGTTSVLSPDLIEEVDYLPGGYGVQFGRSLGGVVDIKTRSKFEEQGRLTWGTDILDSQVYYEGRLGKDKKHGVAVGARRSYVDAFLPLVTGNTGFLIKPRYWDYQLKWVPETAETTDTSVFVYGFDDLLTFSSPDDVAQGADQDTQGDLRTQYNSHRVIGRWRSDISDELEVEFTPSVGVDSSYLGLGEAFILSNSIVLTQLRGQAAWRPNPHITGVAGVDLFGGFWEFDFTSAVRISDVDDPLAEREGISFDGKGQIWSPDLFVKAQLRPLSDPDRWLITPGVRMNNVLLTQTGGINNGEEVPPNFTISADPRLLTRFQLTEPVALKAATGLYHQPPQPQEALGVGTSSNLGYEQTWTTTFGWEHRISQALFYDVDLFYKGMSDLILLDEAWTGIGSNPFFNGGDGRAYGLELIARHEKTGPFFGWVSYTLSRSVRRDSPYCSEPDPTPWQQLAGTSDCFYPFDFDQTHIFSAQAGYDLPYDFGLSAQVQYVTGNPSEEFNAGIYDVDADFYNGFRIGEYNGTRLPPFFQTSLRADKLWTFKRWQLQTYVDLLNAVRGVNPEFAVYNYDFSEFAYVRGLPFIPNIGLEAKFWL